MSEADQLEFCCRYFNAEPFSVPTPTMVSLFAAAAWVAFYKGHRASQYFLSREAGRYLAG